VTAAFAATRTANLAGLACLPFVVVLLIDGFWKARLARAAPAGFWAADIAEWIVLPALSVWLLHRFARLSPRDYGLAWPGAGRFAAGLFLCTLTLFLVNAFGSEILGPFLFGYPSSPFDFSQVFKPLGVAGTLYLAATASVCESIFELALPWLWFSQEQSVSRGGMAAFAVVASLIFALTHWESGWPTVTGAFLFQLVAVAWYFRLRTLYPIIGAHFLIDLYWFWPKDGMP
jgi:hypothetical protein